QTVSRSIRGRLEGFRMALGSEGFSKQAPEYQCPPMARRGVEGASPARLRRTRSWRCYPVRSIPTAIGGAPGQCRSSHNHEIVSLVAAADHEDRSDRRNKGK